jgi:hypothetical protein
MQAKNLHLFLRVYKAKIKSRIGNIIQRGFPLLTL